MTCCPFRVELQIFSVFALVFARGFVPERDDSGSSGVVSVKLLPSGIVTDCCRPRPGVCFAVYWRGGIEFPAFSLL